MIKYQIAFSSIKLWMQISQNIHRVGSTFIGHGFSYLWNPWFFREIASFCLCFIRKTIVCSGKYSFQVLLQFLQFFTCVPWGTLQFQIIVPPAYLIFGFFVGTSPPPHTHLLIFQIFFVDISETVKTDCSVCGTVSSLVQTVLISYQF